jgi:beta-galactosidase
MQPDWVHIDNIGEYPAVYLPYPVMLSDKTVFGLRAHVENGGLLISEGTPGYFGDAGHAGATQPNRGLAELLGAVETDADFTPDLFRESLPSLRRQDHRRPLFQADLPRHRRQTGRLVCG